MLTGYSGNKTSNTYSKTGTMMVPESIKPTIEEKNPSPGVCLPVIVNFCQYHKVSKLIKSS